MDEDSLGLDVPLAKRRVSTCGKARGLHRGIVVEWNERMFERDEIISTMQHWERVIAHAQAEQLKAIAELVQLRRQPNGQFSDYAIDEIALALNISGIAAGYRLDLALDLTQRLPATLAALDTGQIDLPRA
ncbi:MAG TPA: DUF222 domain-containing protein, partial [Pseudonocardiaceae bacterium]